MSTAHTSKDFCPSGHALQAYTTAGGHCRRCFALVPRGQTVWDCSQCKWWLCGVCAGREVAGQGASSGHDAPQQFEAGHCPQGHVLVPYATAGGYCANCKCGVHRGGLVMDCADCKWWICMPCNGEAVEFGNHSSKNRRESHITRWMYKSPNNCPMGIRSEPTRDSSASTGALIKSGTVFAVCEELTQDSLHYLRLADGRGWVFARVGRVELCVRLKDLTDGYANDEWWDATLKDTEVSLADDAEHPASTALAPERLVV